jgi:hypothetical protein
MNDPFIHAPKQRSWEKRVCMKAQSALPGAKHTAVTDFGTRQSPKRRSGLAYGHTWRQYQPRHAGYPVDVGLTNVG